MFWLRALKLCLLLLIVFGEFGFGQSGKIKGVYSESTSQSEKDLLLRENHQVNKDNEKNKEDDRKNNKDNKSESSYAESKSDEDVIRINTDLIIVPVQVTDRTGKAVTNIRRQEFKVFENGIEQEIAYFSAEQQPFTVVLMIDVSFSTIFKISEIQSAALQFLTQLKPEDKVMVVAFDKKVHVLCKPTNNRYAAKLAIEATKNHSGTSLYLALDEVLEKYIPKIEGRKAIVLLTDGVDTTSPESKSPQEILKKLEETDALVYVIKYDTYDDVQKTRNKFAETDYDENDKPYTPPRMPKKGERVEDYKMANNFLEQLAFQSGGQKFNASSKLFLTDVFQKIAEELRRVYILGYYSSNSREIGRRYSIKVRVYRPGLVVRARKNYIYKEGVER